MAMERKLELLSPAGDWERLEMAVAYGCLLYTSHAPVASYTAELAKIIDDTFSKGGNVIIPSFAVGRTQELLYFMREMKKEGLVKSNPDFTVCVDSPLANEATKIFSGDLRGYLDEEALEVVKEGERLFTFPGLMMTESSEESKLLNLDTVSYTHLDVSLLPAYIVGTLVAAVSGYFAIRLVNLLADKGKLDVYKRQSVSSPVRRKPTAAR